MKRRRKTKGLEFAVDDALGRERIFTSFDEAAGFAISIGASHGRTVHLDVLCWSRAAAKAWGGDYGAEQYDEDPEASVHDRIEIKVNPIGRIA